ncbi:MAG: transglycosylase domain-containing protein [Lachnospiraceae bacterium]|nr:transglycosylase domain-containing protein [Lachnospiraceae bacterium]
MNYGKNGISAKQKKITSASRKLSTKLGITIIKVFLVAILVSGIFVGCAGLGMIKGIIDNAPDISTIDLTPEGYATKFYNTDGEEIASLVQEGSNRISAGIDEMPSHLIYAFVDIEDQRFFDHNGIDIKGIVRAAYKGILAGFHFSEGASTITQQLLKNKIFNSGMDEDTFMASVKRKIQEQYLAIELEKSYSKEEILENYLNMINLGSNTLGVQAASKRYFNKDVWDLTISESAVIAAITQNPYARNPIYYPEKNNERRVDVLKKMLEFGHITQAEYDEAMADDVYTRIQNNNIEYVNNSSVYSSFTDATLTQLISDLQTKKGYTEAQAQQLVFAGGLSVFTTQDKSIQAICDEEYQNEENFPEDTKYSISWAWSIQHADGSSENFSERSLESYYKNGDEEHEVTGNRFFKLIFNSTEEADAAIKTFKENTLLPSDIELGENLIYTPQPQSSFVVMDQSTGYVKAIVGERGVKEVNRSLNRATSSARQPGSTFKIVSTYAAALDTAGFTLASVQYDEAGYTSPDGYPFNNYDGKYIGFCTIREAIEDSINVVAVKTIADITPSLGFSYLKNFGFSTLVESRVSSSGNTYSDINYSLALGGITDGVTNLELTAAYAAIANQGVYVEPILYTKVLDHNGNILIDNTPETHRVIKETTAFLLTSAMQDVVTKGTGTAARIANMPTAGKTGSTSDYNDVWFVGYTPYYTAGIWSGYDENRPQEGTERRYHRALWGKIMTRIHENLEAKSFTQPEGLEKATICKKSGKLAVEGLCDCDPRGSMVVEEYFVKGTAPTETCDNHIQINICKDSGALATENCPAESLEPHVYINSANIPTTVSPDAANAENAVPVMGTSEDLTYLMPDTLKDNYCPIHSQVTPPTADTITTPPEDEDEYDPANEYNNFFGPGSSNTGYGPWINFPGR